MLFLIDIKDKAEEVYPMLSFVSFFGGNKKKVFFVSCYLINALND